MIRLRSRDRAVRALQAELAVVRHRLAQLEAERQSHELAAAGSPTADRAGGCPGAPGEPAPDTVPAEVVLPRGPNGTSGAAAVVDQVPANAGSPAHPDRDPDPAPPWDIERDPELDRPAEVEPIDDEEPDEDFAARVAAASARRAELLRKPAAVDWGRVAAARRATPPPASPVPLPGRPGRILAPALSPEECRRCGIPGRRGCEHQAPYVAPPTPVYRDGKVGRSGARQ